MNIHVHIDRIVVDGVGTTADQADIVKSAVHDELVRLLTQYGVSSALAQGGDYPSMDSGVLQVRPRMSPAAVGSGIGHALHEGLRTIEPPRPGLRS